MTEHNSFIIIYYFRATCFDSLDSSSGRFIRGPDDDSKESKHVALK